MISVIVPVYNVEKYLDNCVQSVLRQTYAGFELILVDDGSTDSSSDMCDEYAQKDNRVKVIHQSNQGPSVARNKASLSAQGEYITFIDSDDYVADDYLESLLSALCQHNADISAVLMKEIPEGYNLPEKGKEKCRIITLTGDEALLNVLYQKDLDTTPCGMLFKKEIVTENPFPAGRYHEDDFTMYRYFEDSNCTVISKVVKYFYVQHESSIMHSKSEKILLDEIDASDNLEMYFSSKNKKMLKAAKSKKFSNYCQILINNPDLKNKHPKEFCKINDYLLKNRLSIILDKETRFKNY